MAVGLGRVGRHPWVASGRAVAGEVARDWVRHRAAGLAAEVAFFAVLSLFPALLALAAALGSVQSVLGGQVATRAQEALLEGLDGVVGGSGTGLVEAVQELFAGPSPGVLTFGALGALYASSLGAAAVIRALDVVYEVEERRPWVVIRAVAVLVALGTIVVGALLLTMVVLGPLLGGGRAVAQRVGLGEVAAFLWDRLRGPATFAAVVAWAATLFHLAPNRRRPWRWDLPGAVATALSWLAVSAGFGAYLAVAGTGNEVLGVLGGGVVVLVWVYLLSLGLLAGAELNAVLARRRLALPADAVL